MLSRVSFAISIRWTEFAMLLRAWITVSRLAASKRTLSSDVLIIFAKLGWPDPGLGGRSGHLGTLEGMITGILCAGDHEERN